MNGLVASSKYFVVGISFSVIYVVTRFFNISHAAFITIGAYATLLFYELLGLPLWLAIILAIAVTAVSGCLTEVLIFRPMRRREATPLVLLLASLGVYVVLQNLISIVFGDSARTLGSGNVREGLHIVSGTITPTRLIIVCSAISLLVTLYLLRSSKIGKRIRAVANDAELASIAGVDQQKVILSAFALGSALAGLSGILIAFDTNMSPTMGLDILLMGIVAAIVGGINRIYGVALGALLIGLTQQIGTWFIGAAWQGAITFVVLTGFLLFRPQGLIGKNS